MNYQIQNRTLSGLKDRVDELEEINEKAGDGVKINNYVKEGARNQNSSNSVSINEFEKLIDRVDANDRLIDVLTDKVKKINSKGGGSRKTSIPQDDVEGRIHSLEKEVEDLRLSFPPNTAASNDGTTQSSISYNLKKKLDSINREMVETKNSVITCQQLLDEKPDFDQLQEIDKVVTDKLNDCIKAVRRQMQEKSESTRSLRQLEKQLRSLYEVLYNQVGVSDSEEDPGVGRKTFSAYSRSPYSKEMTPKGHILKYPVWK